MTTQLCHCRQIVLCLFWLLFGAGLPSGAQADAPKKNFPSSRSTTPAAPDADPTRLAVPFPVRLFALNEVRLLPSPFLQAQHADRDYLLRLNPDRLLSHLRKNAGLKPKAPPYGGWDKNGTGTIGHYLSACALMTAATGDPRLRARMNYIVEEMAACQKARGDGGLYGFAWDADTYFPKMAKGELIPVGVTAWYLTHKTLAGLRDAWLQCDNQQARAVLLQMADWCERVTAKLTPAQWQQMMGGEHGAPHEVFADIYAHTGNPKYLRLAQKFRRDNVFLPVSQGDTSVLNGLHANAQIPEFVGYQRLYEVTGEASWHAAACNFWRTAATERAWVNGGNSQWEHFFPASEFPAKVQDICGPETCNTYNLLKLTAHLYAHDPSPAYVEYYERALYNHILPALNPQNSGFVYYTSMRPGNYRVFSREEDAFWCCVGTGMENPARYGEMIYAHSATPVGKSAVPNLYVNLFVPSELTWRDMGLTLRQETHFPESPDSVLIFRLKQPKTFTLSVRCPDWTDPKQMKVTVNGKANQLAARSGAYAALRRTWKTGDRVALHLPMRLRTEFLPNSRDKAAFLFGPILLAGKLGTAGLTPADFYGGGPSNLPGQLATHALPSYEVPLLMGTPASVLRRIQPVPNQPLTFRTRGVGNPNDVMLIPFYKLFTERYALYWQFGDAKRVETVQSRRRSEAEQSASLEARTVDHVLPGNKESEAAHKLEHQDSHTGSSLPSFFSGGGTGWRDANGWFRYEMKILPDKPMILRCAYAGGDRNRDFEIWVNGTKIATEHLAGQWQGDMIHEAYPIPFALTQNQQQVVVEFRALPNSTAGGVYDMRMLRAK